MSLRIAVVVATLVASSFAAANARAQRNDDQFLRVGLGTLAVGFRWEQYDLLYPELHPVLPSPWGVEQLSALGGFARPELDLAVRIESGFHVGVGGSVTHDSDSYERTSWSVAPHVEYVFAPGSVVRPFVRASGGAQGVLLQGYEHFLGGALGLVAGFHLFMSEHAALTVGYSFVYVQGVMPDELVRRDDQRLQYVESGLVIALTSYVATQSPARPRSGAMAVTLAATDEGNVDLLAEGEAENLRFVIRVERAGRSPRFEACQELVLELDGQSTAMPAQGQRPRWISSLVVERLTAATTVELLDAVVAAEQATLHACGSSWSLEPATRERLREVADR